jgi:hypothetical protein
MRMVRVGPSSPGDSEGGEASMTTAQMARLLALAEKAFGAAREVLAMRGQYFTDITQYGVEAARKMAILVEQSHDAVHSLSHWSMRESINQKPESETAKLLAKAHLNRATGTGGMCGGPSVTSPEWGSAQRGNPLSANRRCGADLAAPEGFRASVGQYPLVATIY